MLGNILIVASIVLVLLTLFQLSFIVLTGMSSLRYMRTRRKMLLDILVEKLEEAKVSFAEKKAISDSSWTGFRKFVVAKAVKECKDITSIYLEPHNKKKLPPFQPGQYLTFNFHIPGEQKPVVRCYSLSDGVSDKFYRISVKKVPPPKDKPDLRPGLSSSYVNEVLKQGDLLDVKVPSGAFFLNVHEKSPVVLIGGGIGVTPVYSMLKTLVDVHSTREIWFFYGVRTEEEIIYLENLKEIAEKNSNINIHFCYSGSKKGKKLGEIQVHAGRVNVDLFKKLLPSSNYSYYLCGPGPFMNAIVEGLEEWGVPSDRINFEAFGPATVKKVKPAGEQAGAAAGSQVSFSKSGKKVAWKADAQSILDFAEGEGLEMASGCRIGNCGTCQVAVKNGKIKYMSDPTFAVEEGSCLACIAVPDGDIEIDA